MTPDHTRTLVEGCIRVPGSRHKSGGHQTLPLPSPTAYDILRRRNPAATVDRLRAALAPELRRQRELKTHRAKAAATVLQTPTKSRASHLAAAESPLRIAARTGLYDTSKYTSPSEARMAVLNHLAVFGWTLEQVQLELAGQLAGLAALYGTAEKQARLLEYHEWPKAVAFVGQAKKPAPVKSLKKNASIYDTSQTLTHSGGRK